MKRQSTDLIVIHCSATKPDMDIGAEWIRKEHLKRGFSDIGYHRVIRRNGDVEMGRPDNQVGAHVAGFNHNSFAICMVGGINNSGKAENNFTPAQWRTLETVVKYFKGKVYRGADIVGHRDLSPDLNQDGIITPDEWIKECPCFDVRAWLRGVGI